MAKLINSLKKLGAKLTGKKIEGTKLIDVVEETADKYGGVGDHITSDTLDITKDGENCNIEIPRKYRKTFLHKLTITLGFSRFDEETEEETEVECGTIEAYAVIDTDIKITINNFENYNKFIVIPTQLVEIRTDDDVFGDTIYSGVINSDDVIQFVFISARKFEYFSTEDMSVFIMNISDSL